MGIEKRRKKNDASNISAKAQTAQESTRVPRPDEIAYGQKSVEQQTEKRQKSLKRITAMMTSQRLKRNKEFQYVYRRGKSVSDKHLILIYVKTGELKSGFSVGKRIGTALYATG